MHSADLDIKERLTIPNGTTTWPLGHVHMDMQASRQESHVHLSESALDLISDAKLAKMKPEDDPEAFLRMFECAAADAQWPKTLWPMRLAPLLSGEAQAICKAFPYLAADYDQLKAALLEQLGVSEESCRKKFRSVTFLPDAGLQTVACQLREFGRRWLKPESRSSAEIVELVIVEQFIQILPEVASDWLSHHQVESLDIAVELIEVFLAGEDRKPAAGDAISEVPREAAEKKHVTEDLPSLSVKSEEEASLKEEPEPERRTSDVPVIIKEEVEEMQIIAHHAAKSSKSIVSPTAGDPAVESVVSQSIKCEDEEQFQQVSDPEGRCRVVPSITPHVPIVIKKEDIDCQDLERSEPITSPTELQFITRDLFVIVKKEEEETNDMDYQDLERSEVITSPTDKKKITEEENKSMDHKQCIESQENKNTRIKTEFDIKMLKTYLTSIGEKTDLKEIPHNLLDTHIANFVRNLKKKDGTEYEPSTVRGIVGSIDRYLLKHHYPHAIFNGLDTEFTETKKTLTAKQKYLKKLGKGKRPQKAQPLSDEDINKLYDTGTMGMQSPTALLNLLFFSIGIQFSLRTQEHYDLKWGDVTLSKDTDGAQFLEYTKSQTTRTGQSPGDVCPVKPRIYKNVATPDRDPVLAYEKYAAHRPKEMKTPDSPFYLAPYISFVQGCSLWFRKKKIGINKMRTMMSTMKTESGLPPNKRITNHSTRKTIMQRLVQSDVPAAEVQPVSSHTDLQRINNYSILIERKQKNFSEILYCNTIAASTSNNITVVSSQAHQPMESAPCGKNNSILGQNCPFNNNNISINDSNSLPTKTKRRRIIQDSDRD